MRLNFAPNTPTIYLPKIQQRTFDFTHYLPAKGTLHFCSRHIQKQRYFELKARFFLVLMPLSFKLRIQAGTNRTLLYTEHV